MEHVSPLPVIIWGVRHLCMNMCTHKHVKSDKILRGRVLSALPYLESRLLVIIPAL